MSTEDPGLAAAIEVFIRLGYAETADEVASFMQAARDTMQKVLAAADAARAASQTVLISAEEAHYLRGLVRQDLKKKERNAAALLAKYGDETDTERSAATIAFVKRVKEKLTDG